MDGQRKSTHAPGRPGRGQTRCKSGGEDAAAHAGAGQAMRSLIRVGRYGVQPQRRLPAIVTTSPQLYCTTPARGRGVLPVLAYYTTSSGREGGAGQVRPGILGTSKQQPTTVPFELSISPSSSRLLCSSLVRVRPTTDPPRVAGFCFLATPPHPPAIYGAPDP